LVDITQEEIFRKELVEIFEKKYSFKLSRVLNGFNQITYLEKLVKNTKKFTEYFRSLDNSLSNIKDIFSVYLNFFRNRHSQVFFKNNYKFSYKNNNNVNNSLLS
jgi:hypothetical protein